MTVDSPSPASGRAPPIQVTLAPGDRELLAALLAHGRISARTLKRGRVLQLLDEGKHSSEVCRALGTTRDLVRRIGLRYRDEGLEAAIEERPRPGSERRLDAKQEAQVVALACTPPPEGHARWTVRLLTREVRRQGLVPEVGRETIRTLLAAHEVKPWREKKVLHSRPHARLPHEDGGRPLPL